MNDNEREFRFEENAFDIVSLVTALWVMLAHSIAWVFFGGTGGQFFLWRVVAPGPAVSVMFAISGYLVTASLERCEGNQQFFVKRLLRIYPAAIVMILIGEVVWILTGTKSTSLSKEFVNVLKEILLAAGSKPNGYIGNGAFWTIPKQVQFYILTPIMYWMLKNRSKYSQVGLMMFCVVLNLGTPLILRSVSVPSVLKTIFGLSCLPHLYMYILGMFLFLNRENLMGYITSLLPVWIVGYIIAQWILNLDAIKIWEYINPISSVFVILCGIGFAYRFGRHRLKLDISYGVYLWHCFFIDLFMNFFRIGNSIVVFILVIVSSVIAGVLSNICIEKTTIKLIKK